MTLANWYSKLNEFLSPSITFDANRNVVLGSYSPQSASSQPLLQGQLLDALNQNNAFRLVQSTNQAARYTPNNYLTNQLAQLPMQGNQSMMQAYNAKMQGYGIAPQQFTPPPNNSATAPTKGGK